MSDDDPSRSPTPPVGPPEAMPPILSFAEKQEVSTPPLASIHIPTSRPHFTSALQCPCPSGIHACVPALGYLGHTHINSESWRLRARRSVSLPLDISGIHTTEEKTTQVAPEVVPRSGLAVERGRNGLMSYLGHRSACHHPDEPRAGPADLPRRPFGRAMTP